MNFEWLLLSLGLVVAAVPLMHVPIRERGFLRGELLMLVVCICVLGSLVTARVSRRVASDAADLSAKRPGEVQENNYVHSDSCQACHPGEYGTWYGSYHRTMTQEATPEAVVGDFNNVTLHFGGRAYRLSQQGETFWVDMDDPLWSSEGIAPRVKRPIVMTTGSHNLQVYWFSTGRGREVAQLPFDYRIAEKEWIPDHLSFVRPPWPKGEKLPVAAPGMWDRGCIRCHATAGRPREKMSEQGHPDTHVAEFGIACEACHGPGQLHVEANKNPARRYQSHFSGEGDSSIVHPGKLSHKRSAQVCGQCHGISEFLSLEDRIAWSTQGYTYRPGDDLHASRYIVNGTGDKDHPAMQRRLDVDPAFLDESFWSDGMVRVSGREYNGLLRTPCFTRGEMSCLSCHVMHQPVNDPRPMREWANDQLALGMEGDEACLKCHPSFTQDIKAHTHHAADSSGSRCYNCHMPYTTYGLHKAIRSHQVDSPTVQASLETGRPNACNQCHLDKTLAWAADHLHSWYGTPKPPLSDDEQAVAASILWTLKGDAGQRALMAWSYGWEDAKKVSGSEWMAPMLAQLLADPYGAVRYIARQSVQKLEGFKEVTFDLVESETDLQTAAAKCANLWRQRHSYAASKRPDHEALLIRSDGTLRSDVFKRLLEERNHRPLTLQE